jgi:nucleotide-binding universal stress UspA family protein
MITLKNVLVATDFGDAAETALAYGRDFARTFGATLHVIHVVDNVLARVGAGEMYAPDLSNFQREVEESARKQLDGLVTDDDRRTLRAQAITRTSNSPALAISAYAKEAGIDLVVMGTHGRGALAHLVMGSVAERVVRIAPCPVLTVRQPEHEFLRPDALEVVAKA